jgi:hypothetical protein
MLAVLMGFTLAAAASARLFPSGHGEGAASQVQEVSWETESVPQALEQGSEQYLLLASELGYVVGAMQSGSYSLNRDVAVQAEGAPPMVSENYRLEGIVRYWLGVPLVLRNFR